MNRFVSSQSVFLPQRLQHDHFSRRYLPFFCLICSSVSACVSVCRCLCQLGLLSCLLFSLFSSQASFALPQKPPPAQSLGFSKGIRSFLPAAAGTFRSTESSSRTKNNACSALETLLFPTLNIVTLCLHFILIGDRSILESLQCKVSSSYRSAMHMLQARNNSQHVQQLQNDFFFFNVKWKRFTLHNVSSSQVKYLPWSSQLKSENINISISQFPHSLQQSWKIISKGFLYKRRLRRAFKIPQHSSLQWCCIIQQFSHRIILIPHVKNRVCSQAFSKMSQLNLYLGVQIGNLLQGNELLTGDAGVQQHCKVGHLQGCVKNSIHTPF